jgi:hypothetical protein
LDSFLFVIKVKFREKRYFTSHFSPQALTFHRLASFFLTLEGGGGRNPLVTSEADTSFNSQFLFLESDIKGGGKAKQETKKCHKKKQPKIGTRESQQWLTSAKIHFGCVFPMFFGLINCFLLTRRCP